MNTKVMTCESYYMRFLSGTAVFRELIEEMAWSKNFSASRLKGRMLEEADSDGVTLLDRETFDYERFFLAITRLQEKNAG